MIQSAELLGKLYVDGGHRLELSYSYVRRQAEDSDKAARLTGWSRAVEQYASQLTLVLEDIDLGFPVALRLSAREVPAVSVAGRTIMLAHPRSDQQSTYEQSVLGHFCAQGLCRELLAVTEEHQQPIPMSAQTVSPDWEFTAAGPLCHHQGLQLSFESGGELGRQRPLCQQFMQEAEELATELAWQQRHGVAIDWQALAIRPVPLRPEHLVVLNTAGDSLLVTLPLLSASSDLLPQLLPWLQGRHATEQGPEQVRLRARELGWE